jgi:hypothetical protein
VFVFQFQKEIVAKLVCKMFVKLTTDKQRESEEGKVTESRAVEEKRKSFAETSLQRQKSKISIKVSER